MIEQMQDAVQGKLGAQAVCFQVKPRKGFDGQGHEIYLDFVVLWRNVLTDDKNCWGTHMGVVRWQEGKEPTASLHWGHYGMEKEEAEEDYEERAAKLAGFAHKHNATK